MNERLAIAREAMRAAFQVRRSLSIPREEAINPFDVALGLGIDVWFVDAPSLEGMFTRSPEPRIILPSMNHRPLGRLCFTCAHELGHAQLGHGERVDEYLEGEHDPKDPDEIAANVFASSLLMPRPAVLRSFEERDTSPADASGLQLLTIAYELAVGLEALVKHLRWGLGLIDDASLRQLLKHSPKRIRQTAFGQSAPNVVIPLDQRWRGTSVDLEVGQAFALAASLPLLRSTRTCERASRARDWNLYLARRPGQATIEVGDRHVYIRVARPGFIGALRNRYLEDPDAR